MMEDISFKLTVIFLLCPILSLALLFFVLFYSGYKEAINLVLSTFTVMSVIILVWERVHDLSLRKLEYVYKHILCEIHKKIYEQKVDLESKPNFSYPIYLKDIKFLIKKLKRTGKILGLVSLYPNSLIKKRIRQFKYLLESSESLIKQRFSTGIPHLGHNAGAISEITPIQPHRLQ